MADHSVDIRECTAQITGGETRHDQAPSGPDHGLRGHAGRLFGPLANHGSRGRAPAAVLGAFESDASHAQASGLTPRAGLLCLPTLSTHGYEVMARNAIDAMAVVIVDFLVQPEHHEILGILGHPRHGGLGAGLGPVSGGMGRAVSVAGLSVPSSWAVAAPEIRAVAFALPATSVGAAPAVWAGSSGTAFSEMALAGMAGSALAGTVTPGRPERIGATTQRAKSPQRPPASPVTGIAADHLRELAPPYCTTQEF